MNSSSLNQFIFVKTSQLIINYEFLEERLKEKNFYYANESWVKLSHVGYDSHLDDT